jgi:2-polyprenyl-6-methoxyphenol hydroxylase-like FAD-dependent oxidoreductase
MTGDEPIAIIGGGPAGCSCALALARLGHPVTLLNFQRVTGWRAGEVAGPKVRQTLAREFGVDLQADSSSPLSHFCACWGSTDPSVHAFEFWSTEPAQVLRRPAFDCALRAAARSAGVHVIEQCSVSACRWDGGRWHIKGTRSDGTFALIASFLVEAGGARSRSVAYPDIARLFFDNQICLSIETGYHPRSGAEAAVEACALGWWYSCPIGRDRQIVSLFTDADLLKGCRREDFMSENLARSEFVARRVIWDGSERIKVSNARTSARTVLWRNRWIPAGDAGFFLDPASGTGIERAVADGLAVARAVSTCIRHNDEAGLRAHAQQRATEFQQALLQRRAIFATERRWKDAPFWARRGAY